MRVISGIHSGAMFMNLVTAIIIYLNCELCTASDHQILIENVTTHGPVLGMVESSTSEIAISTVSLRVNTTIRSSTTTELTSTEDDKELTTATIAPSSVAQPALTDSSVTFSILDVTQQQSGTNLTTMATPLGVNTTENIENPVIITSEEKSSGCSTAKRKR